MPIDNTPAISKMIIRGSPNFSRNCFHKGSFSGGVKILAPCLLRLSSTWASVKPV
ncbi:Uncharacterised protein [Segatella copri]|nr:Uncharacterised protein [Segatella copri]